ncbi:MAG: exodeoxyribonuclease VII large subunit [Gammaproteobacteria bacterium]|nr:exodeoxyribonuclease VII large subunit [Gammaproteobacteria bacterium]
MENSTRHIYSVSELNRTVRQILDIELPAVWLEGEISNLARPSSGHWYFSLKDENAQIRCAMFRRANARVGFVPENGDKVMVRGKISLYEARGDYQLIAEHMEDAGSGALQRAYEQLRDQLSKEGLFAAEHKQSLPTLPHRIGIITSGSGAALHDITQVMQRRMPLVEVLLYPVLVQGELAPAEISHAIMQADHEGKCDVLIVGRGGGSLEDLWAFNDERVARAAFACKTPIISAVGHEVDFTILDFVADLRAPTPSAAAELATPISSDDLLGRLSSLLQHMARMLSNRLQREQNQLGHLRKRLHLAHPGQWVNQQQQRLDGLSKRLQQLMTRITGDKRTRFERISQRLGRQTPAHKLTENQKQLAYLYKRLQDNVQHKIALHKHRLGLQSGKLDALSPLATLQRGYAVVQLDDAKLGKTVVSSVEQIQSGVELNTELHDGYFSAQVTSVTKK